MVEVVAFTSAHLIEGLVAVLVYASLTYVIRDYLKKNRYYVLLLGWFITWLCRKTASSIYAKYLEVKEAKPQEYRIEVPFL